MNNLKTRLFTGFASICLSLLFAIQAFGSIQVGNTIVFQNGPGSPGGEFGVALAATPNDTEMITFCVERNEYINFSDTFLVDSIETYADAGGVGGGPNDPLDARTAWLYYNFNHGTLLNYTSGLINDFSGNRVSSANALQDAVWFLEQELTSAGVGAAFVQAANDEWNDYAGGTNLTYSGNMQDAIDRVRIMNISWSSGARTGQRAQSQLFEVPEPGTIVIWSALGLLGMAGYRRRR